MKNDVSCLILEKMQLRTNLSFLTEQEFHILNEGFKSFILSIKNFPVDRIKKIAAAKYTELENIQKENELLLKKNKIDISKLSSIINNVIVRYKSKIQKIGKKRDGNSLGRISKEIGEKIKNEVETKQKSWSNFKYFDPENIIGPLILSIILIIIKAFLLLLLFAFFPISTSGIPMAIFHIFFIFVVMPIIEERSRFVSVQSGTGGNFTILYGAADFALMFLTKILTSGTIGILSFILVRIFSSAIQAGNWYIQKAGYLTDESEISFRISWCLNGVRTAIETFLLANLRTF